MKPFVCLPVWLERTLFMACAFVITLFIYAETTIGYLLMLALVAATIRNEWMDWRGGPGRGRL